MRLPKILIPFLCAPLVVGACSSGGPKAKTGTTSTTSASSKTTTTGPATTVTVPTATGATPVSAKFSGKALAVDPQVGVLAVQVAGGTAVVVVRAAKASISGATTKLAAIDDSMQLLITGTVRKVGEFSVYDATQIETRKPPPTTKANKRTSTSKGNQ